MAFFSKVGNILKQSVSKQITSQFSAINPSIYQAIRCMSSNKLFVGGLPFAVDDTTLRETFTQYGEVVEARVIVDRESGRSRGFGFITYTSTEEATSAIQAMDGQDLHGRRVRVNFATDRPPRQFGGGGYGGGGYGGGGYGGGGFGGGGGYGGSGGSYGDGGYGGGQNYGGGNSGGFSGGAPAGGQYGGGSYGSGGGNYGVAGGTGGSDTLFDGGSSGSNATANTGLASSGFEQGSGLGYDDNNQFGSNATGAAGNDNAGEYDPAAADTGFASSGLEQGSGLGCDDDKQFGSNATGAAGNDNAGEYDPSEPVEGNFRDDEPDDFAKRA